eukprot:XP_001702890.1 predicted protein [Chlamydomonas reinhardtii]
MSSDTSFAAAGGPSGHADGPGSAQPYARAPSLRQAASFLRSSFSASARFLNRMGSANDPTSRSAAAGLPPTSKGPRESFIGSLLNAVGLGGGGHGRASGPAGAISPSGGSRSGPSVTGRSKLMTSPTRTLARLSSAAAMRAEIQNYSQFGDLRNDSFSQASTAKLRRRSSLTGSGIAGAADEALAAAAAMEAAAAASGGGGAAGLFRKLGSISLLRQSAPAPLSYSPSIRASAPGIVHNADGGASPPGGMSCADHGYVAEAGGAGAPPPGALSRSGSLALRERPPTPKGRSPRNSVNGSPGRLGKVLGSFRLPDILTGGGSGRSVTERRNSVSGGTAVGAGSSFTRPSAPVDMSIGGATGPAAAAVAAARQYRLSSGGAGAAAPPSVPLPPSAPLL